MTQSFDVKTCHDMLNKLERERGRIDEAGGDREKLSDHGINFAVTAWHLTDWVWRDMKGMHELKARIAKAADVPAQKLELKHFQQYVCAECPQMVYCQAIGTASKHVGADPTILGQGTTRSTTDPHRQGAGHAHSDGPSVTQPAVRRIWWRRLRHARGPE